MQVLTYEGSIDSHVISINKEKNHITIDGDIYEGIHHIDAVVNALPIEDFNIVNAAVENDIPIERNISRDTYMRVVAYTFRAYVLNRKT